MFGSEAESYLDTAISLCNDGRMVLPDDTVVEVWFVPSDGRAPQLWKPASMNVEARRFCERVGHARGSGALERVVVG